MAAADGIDYAPKGRPAPVCAEGEFVFAAIGLDHGHIYGMCNGLTEAGGQLKWVYDPDLAKAASFVDRFPQVEVAASEAQVLDDPHVQMVAGATVPSDHLSLGPGPCWPERTTSRTSPPSRPWNSWRRRGGW